MNPRAILTAAACVILLLAAVPAQTGASARAATSVGVTSAVNPQATGTPLGGTARTLVLGKKIFYNERIKTSAGGLVQLLLLDGSAFTIGPNSELRIDKFVYDPETKTGKIVANFVKGAFRFVGGRISKNRGGVSIRTSVATLGVRGGMVSGHIGPGGKNAKFNFLFGKQMSVGTGCSGNAASTCRNIKRVFQNGNTVHVNPAGRLELRRTTRGDIAGMQKLLAGKAGKNGGARTRPTNRRVAGSAIGRENSSRTPRTNAPAPKNAVKATSVIEIETEVVKPDDATGEENRDVVVEENNTQPPLAVVARIIEAAPSYEIDWTPPKIINDPWLVGLLGGSPINDYAIAGVVENGRLREVNSGDNSNVPWQTGHFTVSDGIDFDGSIITGRGFVSDNEDFFFYELEGSNAPGSDGSETFLLLGGKAPASTAANGKLRTYDIHPDFINESEIPFALASTVPGSGANPSYYDGSDAPFSFVLAPPGISINVSPYYIKEQGSGNVGVYQNASSSRSVALQASLLINGSGSGQNSYVVVHASHIYDKADGNGPQIYTSLRGSFRETATSGIAALSGAVNTLQGPDGNYFFGDGAAGFVIGNDPQYNDAFYISYSDTTTPSSVTREYGTTHLAHLGSVTAATALPASTSRIINGFASGFMERGGITPSFSTLSGNTAAPNMEVVFNAPRNTLYALMHLSSDDPHVSGYSLAFGSDPARAGNGQSAFIDDDRYAAIHSRVGTFVHPVSDSSIGFPANPVGSRNPNTYFLGNELVPVTSFAPGVDFCECKFLEWGYWGGRLRYKDPQNPGNARRDYAHLNTWVAGVITDAASIPATGSATYAGHVIGNVVNAQPGGTSRYLAAGNFNMNWSFATRSGSAAITNFDGRNLAAPNLTQPSSLVNSFNGALGGAVGGSGSISGAFVSGPDSAVQGAIGNFTYREVGASSEYAVTGSIISRMTSQ